MREPKWRQAYEQLAERARGRVDDVPFLESIIDATDTRADKFADLRKDLAPLRRLLISHLRGSYREASRGDLTQAVAAVWYVAWPFDAWPDALPGGLKDDAKVVSWVADRLGGPLGDYREWEASLRAPSGFDDAVASILAMAPRADMELKLLGGVDMPRSDAPVVDAETGAALQQALRGSKQVRDALHEGKVVRVLGPKRLLRGLSKNQYELVTTADGKIGAVRDASSKKFVGHLRIGQPGAAQVAKATVSVGWAAASAVTMQYYLHNIDSKLAGITRELNDLRAENLDSQVGELDTALQRCREVQEAVERTGALGTQDVSQLNSADDRVDDVFNALTRSLARFVAAVDDVERCFESVEKDRLAHLLEDGAERRITQLQILLYAACVRDRVNALRVLAATEDGEERTRLAQERFEHEHAEMAEAVRAVASAVGRLHISKARLDERWPHLGGPEAELAAYVEAAGRLPSSPEEVDEPQGPLAVGDLPALPAPPPLLTELWLRDGDLVVNTVEAPNG